MATVATTDVKGLWSACGMKVTVRGPDGSRRETQIRKPFACLGSDPRADVVLSDGKLLPCHLYLHATSKGIFCLGLSESSPNGWLQPDVYAPLGPYRIRASLVGGQSARTPAVDPRTKNSLTGPLPRLVIQSRDGKSFERRLSRELTVVGRESPSVLKLKSKSVSRTHCVLFWDGQNLWFVDLLSRDGTLLAGRPGNAALVQPGQELLLGQIQLRYSGLGDAGDSDSAAPQARLNSPPAKAKAWRDDRAEDHERELLERLTMKQHTIDGLQQDRDQLQAELLLERSRVERLAAKLREVVQERNVQLAGLRQELQDQRCLAETEAGRLRQDALAEHSRLESRLAEVETRSVQEVAAVNAARLALQEAAASGERELGSQVQSLRSTLGMLQEASEKEQAELTLERGRSEQLTSQLRDAEQNHQRELFQLRQRAQEQERLAEAERERLCQEVADSRSQLEQRLVDAEGQSAKEVAALSAARSELEEAAARRERELHGQVASLEETIGVLQKESERLTQRLREAEQRRQALQERERLAEAKQEQLRKEALGIQSQLNERLADVEAQSAEEVAALRTTQSELEEAAARRERELHGQVASLQETIGAQQQVSEENRVELAQNRIDIEQLTQRLSKAEQERQALQERERLVEFEREQSQDELALERGRSEQLTSQLRDAEQNHQRELFQLRQRAQEQERLAEAERERLCQEVADSRSRLEQRLADVEAQSAEEVAALRATQSELEEAAARRERELQSQAASLQETIGVLKQESDESRAELGQSRIDIEQLTQQLREAEQERQSLQERERLVEFEREQSQAESALERGRSEQLTSQLRDAEQNHQRELFQLRQRAQEQERLAEAERERLCQEVADRRSQLELQQEGDLGRLEMPQSRIQFRRAAAETNRRESKPAVPAVERSPSRPQVAPSVSLMANAGGMEDVVQKLLGYKEKQEAAARRRRRLWGAAAAALLLIMTTGVAIVALRYRSPGGGSDRAADGARWPAGDSEAIE